MCIYHLAKMAGVKLTPYYNVTGIDPPELIYFIREHYPDVIFSRPKTTMLALFSLSIKELAYRLILWRGPDVRADNPE